jgi:hypothetical protein
MKALSRPTRSFVRRHVRALASVVVLALAAAGTATAVSSRTAVAPSNSSPPTITGNPATGGNVTANPGTWTGSAPISFQYQWRICDGSGNACHDISGATSQTYQVKDSDAGNTLRVHVIASNGDGSSSVTSAASAKIAATPSNEPANSSSPSISGNPYVGATLTANPGTWTGPSPISFQYQWQVCDGNGNNCHDIGGATGQTYQPGASDNGNTIRVRVIASNPAGSSNQTSGATPKIGTAPAPTPTPRPTGCPKLAAGATSVSATDVSAPARLQITGFQSSMSPLSRSMSDFTVRFHVADTCGQAVQGAQVYATAVPFGQVSIPQQQQTDSQGNVTLQFHRLGGFPAARNQQLLVMFVRATRPGDNVLAGISTRRLVSLRVNLHVG